MDFHENKIENVTIGHGPVTLGYLGLDDNNVRHVTVIPSEAKKMVNLQNIDLNNNPIQCDCMLWLNITLLNGTTVLGTCQWPSINKTFPLFFPEYKSWCNKTDSHYDGDRNNCNEKNEESFCQDKVSSQKSGAAIITSQWRLLAVIMVMLLYSKSLGIFCVFD